MAEPARTPPPLPARDRAAILAALGGVVCLCWAWLVRLAADMDAMDGMGALGAEASLGIRPWGPGDLLMMFLMWAVMMVGMMLPSAAPTTLVYAAVARKAARQGTPVAPTAAFVAGYLAIWTLFSLAATGAQWALERAALLSPMLVTSSAWLGALLLAAAGLYQLTPAKDVCLRRCRAPAHFIADHWRPGAAGAFRMGAVHGAFCLGCCWALMGLLFFGGVMNLLWIAAITLFVLGEKLLPAGRRAGRWGGAAMLVAAALLVARWLAGGAG